MANQASGPKYENNFRKIIRLNSCSYEHFAKFKGLAVRFSLPCFNGSIRMIKKYTYMNETINHRKNNATLERIDDDVAGDGSGHKGG